MGKHKRRNKHFQRDRQQRRGEDGKFESYGRKYCAGSRLIALGRGNEVERFTPKPDNPEALVQCWRCRLVEVRKCGIGRPRKSDALTAEATLKC